MKNQWKNEKIKNKITEAELLSPSLELSSAPHLWFEIYHYKMQNSSFLLQNSSSLMQNSSFWMQPAPQAPSHLTPWLSWYARHASPVITSNLPQTNVRMYHIVMGDVCWSTHPHHPLLPEGVTFDPKFIIFHTKLLIFHAKLLIFTAKSLPGPKTATISPLTITRTYPCFH